jgi:hypothetical protein
MSSRVKRVLLAMGLAGAAALSTAVTAAANGVLIGSDLSHPVDANAICHNCTTLQQAQVGGSAPNPLTSPVNGTVVSWAVRTSEPGALYTLRILRPVGTNTYLGAGTSPGLPAVPGGTTDGVVQYAASLPIKQGDSIGLYTGGAAMGLPQRFTNGVNANVIANNFTPAGAPPDGQTAAFTPDVQHELLLRATVEFCKVPDLAGLSRAAAAQALAAGQCTLGDVAKKKLKRSKKARRKRGKVLKQSLPPDATAAPGTAVDLKIAGLRKKK